MKKKLLTKLMFVALILSAFSASAFASEIHQMRYEYSYLGDVVQDGNHAEVYAICDDCPKYGKMVVDPVGPVLAVRFDAIEPHHEAQHIAPVAEEIQFPSKAYHQDVVLHFGFDKFLLNVSEKRKLEETISEVEDKAGKDAHIRIEGYTCSTGTSHYNKGLSLRRANTVAENFQRRGFSILNVVAKGESHPISTDKKQNRRVEVTITSSHSGQKERKEKSDAK